MIGKAEDGAGLSGPDKARPDSPRNCSHANMGKQKANGLGNSPNKYLNNNKPFRLSCLKMLLSINDYMFMVARRRGGRRSFKGLGTTNGAIGFKFGAIHTESGFVRLQKQVLWLQNRVVSAT